MHVGSGSVTCPIPDSHVTGLGGRIVYEELDGAAKRDSCEWLRY